MKTRNLALIGGQTLVAWLLTGSPVLAESFQGGFGGPEWRLAEIGRASHWLVGGKGAGFVSDDIYIGGAGYSLLNGPKRDDEQLAFSYGGFLVGRQLPVGLDQVVDLEMLVGGGLTGWRSGSWPAFDADDEFDPLVLLELSAGFHWHWLPWLSMGIGGSYRISEFFDSTEAEEYPTLDGFDLRLEMRFGG